MARMLAACLAVLVATTVASAAPKQESLLQTWDRELSSTKETPVTRVVNLLKGMQGTLQKEMDEDEDAYKKLACWCNDNKYGKNTEITDAEAKISELEANIEALTARSSELRTKIQELEAEFAADKEALASATANRKKELKEAHGAELDAIQAIENLKAALTVLGKHTDGGKNTNWHGAASFLQFTPSEGSNERSMDSFMLDNDMDDSAAPATQFMAIKQHATAPASMSSDDKAVVQTAMHSVAAFVQSHNMGPNYNAASGEIVGIMKQMKETMEADLQEAQDTEAKRAGAFDELRKAKTQEIEAGEKMSETKEDELADTENALAEAKEDLEQTTNSLSEAQVFMKNLKKTCAEADSAFEQRKGVRMEEIKAVSETIEILTDDEARDAMGGTYSFVQVATKSSNTRQRRAAAVLRKAAAKSASPQLSMLATSVELDAFTKVKKAIDDMVAAMKQQQADEVKKNGWCKDELQSNEMTNMKTEDLKADLEAKIASLESTVKTLTDETAAAKAEIDNLHLELQRASENRVTENLDFQKTVTDQAATIAVLHKAMERMAQFYDAQLLQLKKQTPPVVQAEYKPNSGSGGVMSMIEKLIFEAKDLTAKSIEEEGEAQAGYEALVADTNASVKGLQASVVSKTEAKATAKKENVAADGDLIDTVGELENLSKTNGDLHAECDYVLKNFMARQKARGQEIEAMQQAKQILSGASA